MEEEILQVLACLSLTLTDGGVVGYRTATGRDSSH